MRVERDIEVFRQGVLDAKRFILVDRYDFFVFLIKQFIQRMAPLFISSPEHPHASPTFVFAT